MKNSVVELDLKGYSDIARDLEEHFTAQVVLQLNAQIQSFVDTGLKAVGGHRERCLIATTGDGAILAFDNANSAHFFGEAVHNASKVHNQVKLVAAAARWFRIGVSTGELAIEERDGRRQMAGSVIARAVRLEAAANIGEIVVDEDTYSDLSPDLQMRYGDTEQIAGKREERFKARRCVVVSNTGIGEVGILAKPRSASHTNPALLVWRKKLEYLQEQYATVANPALKFELKCEIAEALEEIRSLGG